MHTFSVVPSRSGSERPWAHRRVLELFSRRVRACTLQGYLFFGSSVAVSAQVLEVARDLVEQAAGGAGGGAEPEPPLLSPRCDQGRVRAALDAAPLFLILSFKRVQGMDATAARTFVGLRMRLERMGVELVITHLPPEVPQVRGLLASQGLILRGPTELAGASEGSQGGPHPADVCHWFESMEMGLHFCEERFLDVAVWKGVCQPRRRSVTLVEALLAHSAASIGSPEAEAFAGRCEAAAAALHSVVETRRLRWAWLGFLCRGVGGPEVGA